MRKTAVAGVLVGAGDDEREAGSGFLGHVGGTDHARLSDDVGVVNASFHTCTAAKARWEAWARGSGGWICPCMGRTSTLWLEWKHRLLLGDGMRMWRSCGRGWQRFWMRCKRGWERDFSIGGTCKNNLSLSKHKLSRLSALEILEHALV